MIMKSWNAYDMMLVWLWYDYDFDMIMICLW